MITQYYFSSLLHFLQKLTQQVAEVLIWEQHFIALLCTFNPHGHALGLRPQIVLSDLYYLLVDDSPLFVSDHVLLDLEYSIVRMLFRLLLPHYHCFALVIDDIVIQTTS